MADARWSGRPESGICKGQRWCLSGGGPESQAEHVLCPWRSLCFLHTEHRPEAGAELLHLEEAHLKWKLTQQFYLGPLGMAGPAVRADFT